MVIILVLIIIVVICAGRADSVEDQAQDAYVPQVKEVKRGPRDPCRRMLSADDKNHSIDMRGQAGDVIRSHYWRAVEEDKVICSGRLA